MFPLFFFTFTSFTSFALSSLISKDHHEGFSENDPALLSSVRIDLRDEDNYTTANCSGTVISNQHVITAAHCLRPHLRPHSIEFYDGGFFKSRTRREIIKTKTLTDPTDFDRTPPEENDQLMKEYLELSSKDVAILTFKGGLPREKKMAILNRKVIQNAWVKRPKNRIFVAGFGDYSLAGAGDSDLRKMKYQLLSAKESFDLIVLIGLIDKGMISGKMNLVETIQNYNDGKLNFLMEALESKLRCGKSPERKKSGYGFVADGDSGGPWYLEEKNRMYLIGISSRGSAPLYAIDMAKVLPPVAMSANLLDPEVIQFIKKNTGIDY